MHSKSACAGQQISVLVLGHKESEQRAVGSTQDLVRILAAVNRRAWAIGRAVHYRRVSCD